MLRRLHGLVESFCTYEEKDKTNNGVGNRKGV